jgi:hypothetical protein
VGVGVRPSVRRDEVIFHGAVLEQETADGVHQRNVAAGCDRDVERGVTGGVRPPGIDHDQLGAGIRFDVGLDPVEGDLAGRPDRGQGASPGRGPALGGRRRSGQARRTA